MRSQRQLQVGEEMRHALAAVFQRGDIPWPIGVVMPDLITITEVQISPDLKHASVFLVLRNSDPTKVVDVKLTLRTMNKMAGFFRKSLNSLSHMRYMPELSFRLDNSFDYAQNISRLLHKPEVRKDLAE